MRAWLHGALIGWPLQQRMLAASARLLLGLGIDVFDQRKIKAALEVGMWLRLAALVLLYFGVSVALLRGNWQEGAEKTAVTVFFSVAVFGVMLMVGPRISGAFNGSVQWTQPIADWLARWRAAPLGQASGLVMLLLGTGLFMLAVDDPDPLWLWASALVLLGVGLLPVWPARADHGVVVAGVWGFLVVCLMRTTTRDGLFGVMFGLAGVCTMAGVMLSRWRGHVGGNRWFWWMGMVTLLQLGPGQQRAVRAAFLAHVGADRSAGTRRRVAEPAARRARRAPCRVDADGTGRWGRLCRRRPSRWALAAGGLGRRHRGLHAAAASGLVAGGPLDGCCPPHRPEGQRAEPATSSKRKKRHSIGPFHIGTRRDSLRRMALGSFMSGLSTQAVQPAGCWVYARFQWVARRGKKSSGVSLSWADGRADLPATSMRSP